MKLAVLYRLGQRGACLAFARSPRRTTASWCRSQSYGLSEQTFTKDMVDLTLPAALASVVELRLKGGKRRHLKPIQREGTAREPRGETRHGSEKTNEGELQD